MLTTRGAVAAAVIGVLAIAAGRSWAALVVAYFIAAASLSRVGRRVKEERTASIVAKAGSRDAAQVLANGGVFACAALGTLVRPDMHWLALAVGSLATSQADTWATEIGTFIGGEPRSIVTGRAVATGSSGGVTVIGTAAALLGALFVGIVAAALQMPVGTAVAGAVGGFAGAMLDSLLGATIQLRRWCDACNRATERRIHVCGGVTRVAGGVTWMDNDMVNLISTAAGGLLAVVLAGYST